MPRRTSLKNAPTGSHPPIRRILEAKAAPHIINTDESERARIARVRRREMDYQRIYSGFYKVWHEEDHVFFSYVPPVWLHQYNLDMFSVDGLRSLTTKGRQMFFTSNGGIILLDKCIWTPGSISLIYNVNQEEAAATLESRVAAPFRETMPDFVKNRKLCSLADQRIHIMRAAGKGGDSMIYGGVVTGRGGTPTLTWATEFPALCHKDPKKARDYIDGAISGAQYASHHLEGTVTDITGAPILREMQESAQERQLKNYTPHRTDWVSYFYPWFCKPNNAVEPEYMETVLREGRKIDPEIEDYFRQLEDSHTKWQINRQVRTGGIRLSQEQKWWYYLKWLNEKGRDRLRMFEDYPSLPGEGGDIPQDNKYCRILLRTANDEGRINNNILPQAGIPVYAMTDWGWEDQTVFVFMQPDSFGTFWHVLDAFAVSNWTMESVLAKCNDYNWREATGEGLRIMLPHDATHKKSAVARLMLGVEQVSIEDNLRQRGYWVDIVEKPAKKTISLNTMRESFPRMRFHKDNTADLRAALHEVHVETISVDNKVSRNLKKAPCNHYHDALELGARVMEKYHNITANPKRAADLQAFYNNPRRAVGLNSARPYGRRGFF